MHIKKYIRKTAICLIAIATGIMSLTACDQKITTFSNDSSKQDQESDTVTSRYKKEELTTENITLTVWESAGGPDKWIQQAGEKFTEIYPNIKIEFYEADIANSFYMLRTGEYDIPTADLFGAPHDRTAQMVESDIILPVKDYEEVTTNTLSSAYKHLFYNDVMYGYPTSCETYALFYNKKFISEDKIPDTWDKMLSFCESFPQNFPDKYGFLFQCNAIYYTQLFMTRDGNQLMSGTAHTGLMTKSAIQGMELMQSFIPYFPENAIEMTLTDCEEAFLQSKTAMLIDGPWFTAQADISGVDYGIAALPSFENGGTPSLSLSGVRGMFIYKGTSHPDEAAAFAKFLTTKEMQELRLRLTGALPAANIKIDNKKTSAFLSQLEYSYALPNNTDMKNFWAYSGTFCEEIWNGADAGEALAKYDRYIATGSTEGYTPMPSGYSTKTRTADSSTDSESTESE